MSLFIEKDHYYHIYNRANGFERIFLSHENYRFFLRRYDVFVRPYVHTYCYCLMPNHFHLLIKAKTKEEMIEEVKKKIAAEAVPPFPKFKTLEMVEAKFKTLEMVEASPSKFLSKQFSNFFSSYTQAFNKQQGRMGSLFMKNFKRKPITDELYLKNLVRYIHQNPVEAGLCYHPGEWEFSSYNTILQNDNSFLKSSELMEWFDDPDNFRACHSKISA